MPIPGNLMTTAMGVMPHTDARQALETALTLDIPFWPQLPNLNFHEDMYVQASEHFPGMIVDHDKRTLRFSMDDFIAGYEAMTHHMDDPRYFDISAEYSAVYHRFLGLDLSAFGAIHGQLEGPVSFGFNVRDQNDRPILFDDTIRSLVMDIFARRVNIQLERLKEKNPNAFMFIDEPGLQFIFSAMSGYDNNTARVDMERFLSMIERPRGIHLCGNPDWDFLLNMDLDILSLDAYTNKEVISSYAGSIKKFLERGGVICWGIVPTNYEPFDRENLESLEKSLNETWGAVTQKGIDKSLLLSKSLLSPATCCLINPDREKTVEKAFLLIKELSNHLKEKNRL